MLYKKIIAVDFDGTLVTDKFPEIGEPIPETIDTLNEQVRKGAYIILWTCRVGERLKEAVDWCRDHEITIDAVNENLPGIIEAFGGDARKIFANEYWDDRAIPVAVDPKVIFLKKIGSED